MRLRNKVTQYLTTYWNSKNFKYILIVCAIFIFGVLKPSNIFWNILRLFPICLLFLVLTFCLIKSFIKIYPIENHVKIDGFEEISDKNLLVWLLKMTIIPFVSLITFSIGLLAIITVLGLLDFDTTDFLKSFEIIQMITYVIWLIYTGCQFIRVMYISGIKEDIHPIFIFIGVVVITYLQIDLIAVFFVSTLSISFINPIY